MAFRIGGFHTAGVVGAMMLVGSAVGSAQTTYPSFQQPRVVSREFNFAVADGQGITPFVFQWREGTSVGSQISFDLGLADPENEAADVYLILGGQYALTLARSSADMPLDVLFTAGVFSQFGNDVTMLAIPVGASIGHRFPITGTAMAITPYVHPRLALQYVSFDTPTGDQSDTDIDISFDVGGNLELSQQWALRLSAMFGDDDALGLSLAWTPRGLRSSAPARTTR